MRLVTCVVVPIMLLLAGAAYGQTVSGTIVGTLTDATGLAVPGVDITAKSEYTGVGRVGRSTQAGVTMAVK